MTCVNVALARAELRAEVATDERLQDTVSAIGHKTGVAGHFGVAARRFPRHVLPAIVPVVCPNHLFGVLLAVSNRIQSTADQHRENTFFPNFPKMETHFNPSHNSMTKIRHA